MATGPITMNELIRCRKRDDASSAWFFSFICAHSDYHLVMVTSFDGLAAAILKGGQVCTTPNHHTVYQPPTGDMNVSLWSDFWYSTDDYLLWPQHHLRDYPYLPAIPAKPTNPDDPLSWMWQDVTSNDFVPLSGNVTTGLGLLSQPVFNHFKVMQNDMQERVLHYKAASHHPNTAVITINRSMYNVSEQLDHLPATLPQIQYFVVVFQCYFLELHGILNYLEIYEPHVIYYFHHFLFPCLYHFSILSFHFYFTKSSSFCSILTFHFHSLYFLFLSLCYFPLPFFITFCSCYTSILHSYHQLLSTGTISTVCLWSPSIMSYSPFLIISTLISYQSLILSLFHLSIYPFPLVCKTHHTLDLKTHSVAIYSLLYTQSPSKIKDNQFSWQGCNT